MRRRGAEAGAEDEDEDEEADAGAGDAESLDVYPGSGISPFPPAVFDGETRFPPRGDRSGALCSSPSRAPGRGDRITAPPPGRGDSIKVA